MHSINLTITTTKTSILHMSDDQRWWWNVFFLRLFYILDNMITILMIMLGFIDQINIKLSNT